MATGIRECFSSSRWVIRKLLQCVLVGACRSTSTAWIRAMTFSGPSADGRGAAGGGEGTGADTWATGGGDRRGGGRGTAVGLVDFGDAGDIGDVGEIGDFGSVGTACGIGGAGVAGDVAGSAGSRTAREARRCTEARSISKKIRRSSSARRGTRLSRSGAAPGTASFGDGFRPAAAADTALPRRPLTFFSPIIPLRMSTSRTAATSRVR